MLRSANDTYSLSNGVKIPGLAFGTINTTKDQIKAAIEAGYRNIDTAEIYGNEELVGQAIKEVLAEGKVKREDLFISTKLWFNHRSHDMAIDSLDKSLQRLGLDYVDLYLIHWPANGKWHQDWREINADTWRGLIDLYKAGKAKSIGVSNYLANHLAALKEDTGVMPMVDQIEYHPGFAQVDAANYAQQNGTVVEAWSPFGTGEVLNNDTLKSIASQHQKSTAQVILRWLIQKDILPVAKTSSPQRMVENRDIFDFSLTDAEMNQIDSLPFIGGMQFDPDTARS